MKMKYVFALISILCINLYAKEKPVISQKKRGGF